MTALGQKQPFAALQNLDFRDMNSLSGPMAGPDH